MSLLVQQIHVGGFDKNFSYLIYDQEQHQAVVVDPTGDIGLISAALQDRHLELTGIYLTHTHFDHFDGLPAIIDRYGELPIYVHKLGQSAVSEFKKVQTIEDQNRLTIGSSELTVLHTPGHIDDSVCFYIDQATAADGVPKAISGDTLFVGGCGRTTPTRVKDLYESLLELKNLPLETIVYPGHDYGATSTSTIGSELKTNKYYLAKNFNEFKQIRLGKG